MTLSAAFADFEHWVEAWAQAAVASLDEGFEQTLTGLMGLSSHPDQISGSRPQPGAAPT